MGIARRGERGQQASAQHSESVDSSVYLHGLIAPIEDRQGECLDPDIDDHVWFFGLAGPGAYGGGDELDFVLWVCIEPFIYLLIDELERVAGELAVETFDMDRACAVGVWCSLPVVFVA